MGRLIDADKITYQKNNHKGEIGYHFVMKNEIDNAPTAEAIPKADYEARLKADMVAMLEDLQLDVEGQKFDVHIDKDVWNDAISTCLELIQQKIDALKEQTDEKA